MIHKYIMSSNVKSVVHNLTTNNFNTTEISPNDNDEGLNLNGFKIYDISSGDITPPTDTCYLKITPTGITTLAVDKIIPHTESVLRLAGLTVTGTEEIHVDVDQEFINVEEIRPFDSPTNLYTTFTTRTIIGNPAVDSDSDGNVLRFAGMGGSPILDGMVIAEKVAEFHIFKGTTALDKIIYDTTGSMEFSTGGLVGRTWDDGNSGTVRLTIDNTNTTISNILKIDNIQGVSATAVTIVDSVIDTGIITVSSVNVDIINNKTASAGVYIEDVHMNNDVLTVTDIKTDIILASTGPGLDIETVHLESGNITATNITGSQLTIATIVASGSTITIENVLFDGGEMTLSGTSTINSLIANIDTIDELSLNLGVTIENVLIKDGNITMSSGDIFTNTITATSLTTAFIYDPVADNGVDVDGVKCSNGNITCTSITADTLTYGTVEYDSLSVDTINEKTTANGVYVDSVHCKDGTITATEIISSNYPGFGYKTPVRVVSITNITLLGLQTIDGISLSADDRILVAGQTDQKLNGIYDVKVGGWIRSADSNSTADLNDSIVPVTEGSGISNTIYFQTERDPVIGVNNIIYSVMAGSGLSTIHNTLSGVQGGTVGEYYHLNATNYNSYVNWISAGSVLNSSGSITILAGQGLTSSGAITVNNATFNSDYIAPNASTYPNQKVISSVNGMDINVESGKKIRFFVDSVLVGEFST